MANLENVKLETIPTITASMSNASYQGAPGIGIPAGGTTGQILAKVSDTDYDTEWVDQTGGGSSTPGEDGGYYQPSVDTSGNLTWAASKDDMPAVAGSNIMGPKGDKGNDGVTPHIGSNNNWFIGDTDTGVLAKGQDGEPGQKGDKGDKGDAGAQGEKGDKGDSGGQGPQGPQGNPGFSPIATVTQTETGATISIQDATGTTTATITNGQDGAPGADGYTPQRGVDYWTTADQQQIVQDVLAALPDGDEVNY